MTWTNGYSGTATISVTANGCNGPSAQVVRTVTITSNASITSVTGTSPICISTTTTYTANGVVLGGGGSGEWSSSDIMIATVDQITGLVTGIAAGTCTITYTITGGCGGTVSASKSITINPTPVFNNPFPATVCSGSTLIFNASTTPVSSSTTWTSTAVAGITGHATSGIGDINEILTNNTAGSLTLTYNYTVSANGCVKTESFTVTVYKKVDVVVSATPNAVCPGFPFDLYSTSNLGTAQPDVLLNENFNTGNLNTTDGPNGWTTTISAPNGNPTIARFTIRPNPWTTRGVPLPYFPVAVSSPDASRFYISDNSGNLSNPSSCLISPATGTLLVNTSGYTTLTLDFWHYYRDKGPKTGPAWWLLNDSASIDVSTNDFTTYTTVKVYNQTQGYPGDFAHETVNISGFINQTNVRIRFRFQPTSDYYWAIDNVRVTGTSPITGFIWTASQAVPGFPNTLNVSPGGIIQPSTTTYTATYTDASSTCTGSNSIPVTTYDPATKPILNPAGSLNICTGTQVPFSITSGPGVSRQWSLYGSPQAGQTATTYTTIPLIYFNPASLPIPFQYVTLNITDGNGCKANSDTTKIYISDTVKFGTITSADEAICYNGNPSNITFSIGPKGGAGTFNRQWYYQDGLATCPSGTSTTGWTLIAGATGNTYDPPVGLTVSRTYAALVDDIGTPECAPASWASGCRKVTVYSTVSSGTLTSADEPICYNGDPSNITFSTAPSGGEGTYSYQWYYQDGLATCPSGTSTIGWTLIGGATGTSYDPPVGLTVSRTYAVMVDATGAPDCGVATWASGCRKVTVNPLPTITTTGTAAAVCFSTSAQTTTMPYNATTNSPTSYSIDWNAAANTAGLADQVSTAFAFIAGGGTLTGIVITANTPVRNYSGTMTISNADGCTQTQAVTVTVNPLPTTSAIWHQ